MQTITVDLAQFKQMHARIAELEEIIRSLQDTIQEISTAAGFELGEQFSADRIVEKLRKQGAER